MKKVSKIRRRYPAEAKLEVIRYNPMRRLLVRFLLPLLVLLLAAVCYYLGGYYVWRELDIARDQYVVNQTVLFDCQTAQQELRQQLAMQEQSGHFDRNAAEQVRQNMKALKEVNAHLTKELSLYREVLAPRSMESISVQRFEILPTADVRRFRWKVVLAQTAAKHPFQKGVVELSLIGQREGKQERISVHELSSQVRDIRIPVGFRYYQSIPSNGDFADLQLPENFRPEYFQVTVSIENPRKSRIDKRFNWITEEAGAYVGKIREENQF